MDHILGGDHLGSPRRESKASPRIRMPPPPSNSQHDQYLEIHGADSPELSRKEAIEASSHQTRVFLLDHCESDSTVDDDELIATQHQYTLNHFDLLSQSSSTSTKSSHASNTSRPNGRPDSHFPITPQAQRYRLSPGPSRDHAYHVSYPPELGPNDPIEIAAPRMVAHEQLNVHQVPMSPLLRARKRSVSPNTAELPSPTLTLSGRKGHAHFINGVYLKKVQLEHDGRPVYEHMTPIPRGYQDASGKRLQLYYHSGNDAWAISTALGSLDVLAYILGDIMDPGKTMATYGRVLWNVSDGRGQYEVDENVRIYGDSIPVLDLSTYDDEQQMLHRDSLAVAHPHLPTTTSSSEKASHPSHPLSRGVADPKLVLDSSLNPTKDERRHLDSERASDLAPQDTSLNTSLNSSLNSSMDSNLTLNSSQLDSSLLTTAPGSSLNNSYLDKADPSRHPPNLNDSLTLISDVNPAPEDVEASFARKLSLDSNLSTLSNSSDTSPLDHDDLMGSNNPAPHSDPHHLATNGHPRGQLSHEEHDDKEGRSDSADTVSSDESASPRSTLDDGSTVPKPEKKRSNSMSFKKVLQKPVTELRSRASSMRSTLKKTKVRLSRWGHSATPAESMRRLLEKYSQTTALEDRLLIISDLQNRVRRPRSPKDEISALRNVLLDVWETLFHDIEKVDPEFQDPYFDGVIAVMVKEELGLHLASPSDPWVPRCVALLTTAHEYVEQTLGRHGQLHESLSLFCAKILAVNYFSLPGLADVLVNAVVAATPVINRRSRKIGVDMCERADEALRYYSRSLPREKKALFAQIYDTCRVDLTAHVEAHTMRLPSSVVEQGLSWVPIRTPPELVACMSLWKHDCATNTADMHALWKITPKDGPWTDRFILSPNGDFSFLTLFLEVLFRRCRTIYQYPFYRSKADQLFGINQRVAFGCHFMPGFTELGTCFLRLALTTDAASKRYYRVGNGPPALICNWTDRTAACALTLSLSGVFFSSMLQDLMEQTSTSHVIDVMALLGSFKALFESYDRMHESQLGEDIDIKLVCKFVGLLLACPHYVVIMFTLRWIYDCLDYFSSEHRLQLTGLLVDDDTLTRIFCHWEPSVRHLFHMILLYRFVDPASLKQQNALLRILMHEFELALAVDKELKPIEEKTFFDAESDISLQLISLQQIERLRQFLWKGVVAHKRSPPFDAKDLIPWKCPQHETCGCPWPVHHKRYCSSSLEELRKATLEAHAWVKEHRQSSDTDEFYPPITLSLPPMQNMTSAYSVKPSNAEDSI